MAELTQKQVEHDGSCPESPQSFCSATACCGVSFAMARRGDNGLRSRLEPGRCHVGVGPVGRKVAEAECFNLKEAESENQESSIECR